VTGYVTVQHVVRMAFGMGKKDERSFSTDWEHVFPFLDGGVSVEKLSNKWEAGFDAHFLKSYQTCRNHLVMAVKHNSKVGTVC